MQPPALETFQELLGTNARYLAPVFQRRYEWGADQLSAFMDDIRAVKVSEDQKTFSEQFIGAFVLQDLGKMGAGNAPTQYLIIDGQQRLTTAYLIIVGIAQLFQSHNAPDDAEATRHEHLMVTTKDYKGTPKLVPTMQDRNHLYNALRKTGAKQTDWQFGHDIGIPGESPNKLDTQMTAITTMLNENFVDDGVLRNKDLHDFYLQLTQGLKAVVIYLAPTDDATSIFGKLNFGGIPLGIQDLMRNEVFSRLTLGNNALNADEFHKKVWSKFEAQFKSPNHFEEYLTQLATIKSDGKSTKETAFNSIRSAWPKTMTAHEIVHDLATYAPYHTTLNNSTLSIPLLPPEVATQLLPLIQMPKLSITWPYVMQVLHAATQRKCTPVDARDCLSIIERFLVRRALVGIEPTGLHVVFKSMWQSAGANPLKLREKIITKTVRSPTNEEIRTALQTSRMDTSKITRFILRQYEVELRSKMKGDPELPTAEPTIEHVLPKKIKGKKNKKGDVKLSPWSEFFTDDLHKQKHGLLGNLVLLSGKQNSALGNQGWAQKANRYKASNWLMASRVGNTHVQWSCAELEARNETLIDFILGRWPELPPIPPKNPQAN